MNKEAFFSEHFPMELEVLGKHPYVYNNLESETDSELKVVFFYQSSDSSDLVALGKKIAMSFDLPAKQYSLRPLVSNDEILECLEAESPLYTVLFLNDEYFSKLSLFNNSEFEKPQVFEHSGKTTHIIRLRPLSSLANSKDLKLKTWNFIKKIKDSMSDKNPSL